ncbi:hypothetical protein RirG_187840 [Rhizophagus irregularis DAOM 197198w]|uniref:Uncharacterized protein n=1 Tax=Rhizophagus irregularis (strain DAOM 197198w) TaxID=1432141 RepID=A0A015IYV1_RHIIW|nr:hypothetical protein RirG_187840 [Rhizophagus irregularis DAOM 197198w]
MNKNVNSVKCSGRRCSGRRYGRNGVRKMILRSGKFYYPSRVAPITTRLFFDDSLLVRRISLDDSLLVRRFSVC